MVGRSAFLLGLLVVVSTPASALYDDMTFTTIITDGADAVGFNDIQELALGEPGDDTIVVRIKPAAFTPAPPPDVASIDYWPDDLRLIFRPNAAFAGGYTGCTIDGSYGYCILPYDALDLAVGGEVPAANAISYLGSAVDCAPGDTPGLPCVLTPETGIGYILQGCTALSCMGGGAPSVLYSNLTTAAAHIAQSFESSNGTYQFNWTTDLTEANLRYTLAVAKGSAQVTILDGAGATVLNQTFTADADDDKVVAVAPGDWSFRIVYTGFNGTLGIDVGPVESTSETGSSTTTSSGTTSRTTSASSSSDESAGSSTTGTSEEPEKDSPGLPLVGLIVALAMVVAARRRLR